AAGARDQPSARRQREDRDRGVQGAQRPRAPGRPHVLEARHRSLGADQRLEPERRVQELQGQQGPGGGDQDRPGCALQQHGPDHRSARPREPDALLAGNAYPGGKEGGRGVVTAPTLSLYQFMPYGAPELKEVARKYMVRALGAASAAWLVLFMLSMGTS